MELSHDYQEIVQRLLAVRYETATSGGRYSQSREISDRLILDPHRDQYLWLRFGWDDKKLVQYIILYLSIKNGKIWIEQDATDLCIVDDLLAAGIPAEQIVLGFHHPRKRKLTEFATA